MRTFIKSEKVFILNKEKEVPHPLFKITTSDAVFFNYTDKFLNENKKEIFNDILADYLLDVFHKDIQNRINTYVDVKKGSQNVFDVHYATLAINAISDHSLFLGEISELMKNLNIKHYYVISFKNSEIILTNFLKSTMPILYSRMINCIIVPM